MKLSTKGRYGLRAIIDLAISSENEPVALSAVAERTGISISYLEQLIAKLKKAELVKSIRGAQGGYSLSREADKISVGDILRALEGDLSPVECVNGGKDSTCEGSDICVTKLVWQRIYDSINTAIDSMMLSELVEESKSKHSIDKKVKTGC